MNRKIGMIGSLTNAITVLAFAICLLSNAIHCPRFLL